MKKINFYFFEFALLQLLKYKTKSLFIFFILLFLVFILTAVFQISYSLKHQTNTTIELMPDIVVQNYVGGFQKPIDQKKLFDILQINGITSGVGRVWGYYRFNNHNFTILGIDPMEQQYKEILSSLGIKNNLFDTQSIVIGADVKKELEKTAFEKEFNFILANGELLRVAIKDVIQEKDIVSKDLIIMHYKLAQKILEFQSNQYTDLGFVVPNIDEIDTIKYKIETILPGATILTKEDIQREYSMMFDYKGGLFLVLYIVALLTFFIIVYDKISLVSSHEKKEIGILKAIGWSTNHILQVKFYEGFIISVTSFLSGVILALIYVYLFDAFGLKDIFISFGEIKSNFVLEFRVYVEMLVLVFLVTIPTYILATIFPSWKIAISDVDEVLR